MAKRPFIRKQKRRRHGQAFWDHEYATGEKFALSTEVSEDLAKFMRWLDRQGGEFMLSRDDTVLDLGCGNGRNLIYLAQHFGITGTGYDISTAAIAQAKQASSELPLTYDVRSVGQDIPLADDSQNLVLDMMTSHFLKAAERTALRDEIHRVLQPGGWLFMKTFLRDGDKHSERLIADHPSDEPNTYIHPVIGVSEHVYSEEELREFLSEQFTIHKIYRSHKHVHRGRARKRRTISVYAQKDPYR